MPRGPVRSASRRRRWLRPISKTRLSLLVPVANRFFGGNIGVTGLLAGADVAAELADQPEGDRYLLPDVVLSRGRFLDGETVAALPRAVEVVATDGASLVRAVTSQAEIRRPGL